MAGLADPAVTLVEAHHIDYFTTSQNNDTTNIIIISPNYHRIIHKNNPVFNCKKFQFEFPNGELLKLKLYDHFWQGDNSTPKNDNDKMTK